MRYSLAPKHEIFSYSRISSYKICHRKDWFKYRLGFPKKPTVQTETGNLIHLLLELYVSRNEENINKFSLIDIDRDDSVFIDKNTFEASLIKTENCWAISKERYATLDQEAMVMIINEDFKEALSRLAIREAKEGEKTFSEARIEQTYDDFSFVGFVDNYIIENNKIIIVDYKSGKVTPNFKQLEVYAYYLGQKHPEIDSFTLKLYFTKHGEVKQKSITRADFEKIEEYIFLSIEDILNDDAGKASMTSLCDWCDYQDSCLKFNTYKKKLDLVEIAKNKINPEAKYNIPTYGSFNSSIILFYSGKEYTRDSLSLKLEELYRLEGVSHKDTYMVDVDFVIFDNYEEEKLFESDRKSLIDEFVGMNNSAKTIIFLDPKSKRDMTGLEFKKGDRIKIEDMEVIDV